ncbi:MAG: SAM-dependent methyltransferase TehB [Lautropia sp.]|nr:SAM-dependent methyltransferase TehB [Lautropia sp.]
MSDDLIVYKRMPVWRHDSIPNGFLERHNTREGTWAQLHILQGSLDFALLDVDGQITQRFTFDTAHQPPLILPQQWHQILSTSPDLQCQLDFLCEPADYFSKKYGLTRVHSEVLAARPALTTGRALDVGCGNGRNTLYLARQGFAVDGWDHDSARLANLQQIADAEGLSDIYLSEADLNVPATLPFDGPYDFILSTVVLMFLQPEAIGPLIRQMQAQTSVGGCHLIVSAMDSDDYPCRLPFPFRFQPGELRQYYQEVGWEILTYNENPGKLHRTDENGQRIEMRFATLLARCPH